MTTPTLPRLLDAQATGECLPFAALVDALAKAAAELADGRIQCPPRLVVPMASGALLLSMPAVAADVVAHKLITVTPANAARGEPVIRGQVSVIDPHDGRTRLLLDGPTVTGRRTAAVSMLALRALWPQGPRQVCIVGRGAQAQHHAQALAALHPQVPVRLLGRDEPPDDNADVLITCTTSARPVYTQPAQAGRLLIAVGAFQPHTAEIGAATVRASRVFVDDPVGAAHEAGDILLAGVPWAEVRSLAQALQQGAPAGQPLLFKSVGCAAWDLAAARVALALASACSA